MEAQTTPLNGLGVLILEDDFFQADNARRILEATGAQVIGPFPDVPASLAALKDKRPDCALLDINLGAGPTFEAARAAQALGIPVIFLTGYDQNAMTPEFSHVERLEKPIHSARLVAAVSKLCLSSS